MCRVIFFPKSTSVSCAVTVVYCEGKQREKRFNKVFTTERFLTQTKGGY